MPDEQTEYDKRRKKAQSGDTMAQLKDDIDSGRTGDKIAFPDPAAAPLGTDDEAAGTSTDPKLVKEVRQREKEKVPT